MLPGPRVAALGFFVCLQATCASVSRTPPPEPTAPPQPDAQISAAASVEPPASDVASTIAMGADPNECALISPSGEPIATVALGDRINPSNAPRPSNEGERLLFRQLYETLVRADCLGRVVPGLAASWRLDPDGRSWIVRLRAGAQFSDGTPVTAVDVRASWLRDGRGDALHPLVSRLIETIVPIGDDTLSIRLHSQRVDMPLALAHPDLAVTKAIADSQWPLGTRGARVAPAATTAQATSLSAIVVTRDNLPALRFLVRRGDPRDLLDHGVDLLLTRDPAALGYAATLPQFESVPLRWGRTYVLLMPGRARTAASLSDSERQVLADDAVRGEARGAQRPFWWEMWPDCSAAAPDSSPKPPALTPRIVYDTGDSVARDLAERLVGLSQPPGVGANALLDVILPDRPRRTFQRASGLTGGALTATQRRGADAGYIVSLENRPHDPCRELLALLESAPWLDPETIVALVDAREQAIVRRGMTGFTAEWDGGLVLDGPAKR